MRTNQDYKNAALAALKGNWATAVLATLAMMAVIYIFAAPYMATAMTVAAGNESQILGSFGIYFLALILLYAPMVVGYFNATAALAREGDNRVTYNTFYGTFHPYGKNVWAMFLYGLFTTLWSFLFIIPGIIKSFAYAMTPYIVKDFPELTANQAIDLSCKMMKGHKFDLFWLILSFIGWAILNVFTFGIGTLWLYPYIFTTMAGFYEDVKNEYLAKQNN